MAERKAVLVYDGECPFCKLWVERARSATGHRVDYAPYQTSAGAHPEIPRERFAESVYLFEPQRTTRAAEAVFRTLSHAPGLGWLPRLYWAPVMEPVYRFIAARRPLFARLTRLFWGESVVPAPIDKTVKMVLAGIGFCYLIAFVSLGVQVRGLIGSDGIMPAASLLAAAKTQLGGARFWLFPSVAWLSASDRALSLYCWLGGLASLGLVFDMAAVPCAFLCWFLYLSLSCVGADFMSFQWDVLLLEAGLIAVFLAPWRRNAAPSRGALWLMRFLLLKLMLQSGLVKIFSGDPSWRNLTALTYHYWTQPLPTPLAWYMNRLPLWAHKVSCLAVFCIELVAPILVLFPRRARAAGACLIGFLMVVIALSGNYGFFNLLTIVLCLSCLDDRFFKPGEQPPPQTAAPKARTWSIAVLATLSLTIGLFETLSIAGSAPPAPVRALISAVSPFRSFNSYGLFAVMTKTRSEIAIEVTSDGREWLEWPFLYKPGAPHRAPVLAAPHMPRLDWQCWFASLGEPTDSPWFGNLIFRLLEGSPSVTRLMGPSPLGSTPPLYARAIRYETSFSPRGPDWWARTRQGLFFPVVSLKR